MTYTMGFDEYDAVVIESCDKTYEEIVNAYINGAFVYATCAGTSFSYYVGVLKLAQCPIELDLEYGNPIVFNTLYDFSNVSDLNQIKSFYIMHERNNDLTYYERTKLF